MQTTIRYSDLRWLSHLLLLLGPCGYTATAYAGCGSAVCGVNTQWDAQGVWDQPGLRADLRYEFIDQDQPRHGTDDVSVGAIHRHHDEVRTLNRNTILNVDYGFDARWGVALTVPYVDRDHDHIHHHHGGQIAEAWNFGEIGDTRVIGRYQFQQAAFSDARYGVKFGLKLPTGDYGIVNADGDAAERTLQPGSGTTDALVGAYFHYVAAGSGVRWFGQFLWQQPLNERAAYRPGYQLALDAGFNYALSDAVTALLQANLQIKGRDSGAEAERTDSGARVLSLSPGLGFALTRATQLYGFVQLPVYEYVNGIQLTADVAYVAGVSVVF